MTTALVTTTHDALLKSSTMAKEKYPDRLPLFVEKSDRCKLLPNVKKNKFLVPFDLTVGQLSFVIRKQVNLTEKQAMFLMVNGTMPPLTSTVSQLYEKHKSTDGFLHVNYIGENTFG